MRPIKKIVELVINHEQINTEDAGVSVVSIVDSPAIEVDFFAFKKESFVDVNTGETEEEYIGRCIPELINEGYEQDQAAAICYATWQEEQMSSHQCSHHILSQEQEEGILKMAAELGEDVNPAAHWLELGKTEFATLGDYLKGLAGLDALAGENRSSVTKYQYAGPSAERNFCKAMLRLNRLYTRDELRNMADINMSEYISTGERSAAHGADANPLLDWKSGVNCRHYWNEIQVITQQDGQQIYINKGPANGAAGLSNNTMAPSPNGAVPDNARFTHTSFAVENEDERIIIAPAMIPNKFILRKDEETGELYYVYFSKKTIREIAERFFKKSYQNNTDVNHNGAVVADNTLLESWIIEDTKFDKSAKYGFNLPIGTWMLSYRINDEQTWQKIKRGELKGLSVEGMFIELH
jgi:hypothetical protein